MMSTPWKIDIFDHLPSTQDHIKELAQNGAAHGTVVHALEQSAGYGRHARVWDSARGNLFISFLLKPNCSIQHIGQLSLVIAIAVADVVRQYMREPEILSLKWPNDILIDGQKCAGILLDISTPFDWVAVGVGLNLTSAPPDIRTFIAAHSDEAPSLDVLREDLLNAVDRRYQEWVTNGFENLRSHWLGLAHAKESAISVKIGETEIHGKFDDIDEQGALLLRLSDGTFKKITSGDIYI